AISALDHLDALVKIDSEKEKLIDWIYTFQVQPEKTESSPNDYGFRGCTTCSSTMSKEEQKNLSEYHNLMKKRKVRGRLNKPEL
ncbi:hypothetical protein X975_04693, partial [Stegodyphus mimosarum]